VFCTLPASKAVYLDGSGNPATGLLGKQEGTNFTSSLLIGHATTGTLSSASQNTGVGLAALDALTSGDNNTCVGYQAGTALSTGGGNTIVGVDSGWALSDGAYNALFGYLTGAAISSGGSNVYIGQTAGYRNATGGSNVGIGSSSLKGASGQNNSNNAGLGHQSLEAVTTGGGNIGLGYQSGDNITSGSGNVVIGNADVSSATGSDQLSISSGDDGSVVWMTGDSSANIVIAGTTHSAGGQLTTTGKMEAGAVTALVNVQAQGDAWLVQEGEILPLRPLERVEPGKFVVRVSAPSDAVLVVPANAFRGWQVSVDGGPYKPAFNFDGYASVTTEAGEHTYEFVYRQPMLTGVLILGTLPWILTAGLAVLGLLLVRRQRLRALSPSQ